jgi:hypothetical protein
MSWNRADKLSVVQEYLQLPWTLNFHYRVYRTRLWATPSDSWIHSTPSHTKPFKVHIFSIFNLCLLFQMVCSLQVVQLKSCTHIFISPVRTKYPTWFSEVCKLWSSSPCNFLHPRISFSLVDLNIRTSTCPQTPSACGFPYVRSSITRIQTNRSWSHNRSGDRSLSANKLMQWKVTFIFRIS